MQANDTDRARDALQSLNPDCDRAAWVKAGMAFHAAGGDFDTFSDWSAGAPSYNFQACKATWRSFKAAPGGVGAGALFGMARDCGWTDGATRTAPPAKPPRPAEPPRKPAPGMAPAEVWSRCHPATAQHGYVVAKGAEGVPLEGLRVVPDGDTLTILGQRMAGALVVPAYGSDGELKSLQFVTTGDTAARLKAREKTTKPNLPGSPIAGGVFVVGELVSGGLVYVCEGIGTAWACWRATGHPAVVAFGWGNVARVAAGLRERDATASLVLCPDVGKESAAEKIAADVGALVARMPDGWPNNADVSDLAERHGMDVVAELLNNASEPPKPAPRYKLLNGADLEALPPLAWRVRGVLPAVGLAALYGPSASGKSFLAFDMAAAIAEGRAWFGHRVEPAPVVYAALEGEAGFKLRAQAWQAHRGRRLPDGLHMMLQPFKLTNLEDVTDLASVVPAGAVVVLDTLNRAAPTADENSSKDMGEILEAAKCLQELTRGLVLMIHHTGKNAAAGLRGHSSLFAAMDAAIEVSRDGDHREWKVAKAKDGQDGDAHPFKLQVEMLAVDEYGDSISSCVVMRDTATDEVRHIKLPQGGNQKLVLEALRPMFKTGATGKPGAPPLRPCIELEAAVVAGAGKLTCPTDRRATRTREAITGLVSRGVLGLNEGWLWLT